MHAYSRRVELYMAIKASCHEAWRQVCYCGRMHNFSSLSVYILIQYHCYQWDIHTLALLMYAVCVCIPLYISYVRRWNITLVSVCNSCSREASYCTFRVNLYVREIICESQWAGKIELWLCVLSKGEKCNYILFECTCTCFVD